MQVAVSLADLLELKVEEGAGGGYGVLEGHFEIEVEVELFFTAERLSREVY